VGEAKRRKQALALAPCLCGSGVEAQKCCFTAIGWRKVPAAVALAWSPKTHRNDACYLRATENRADKVSREHLVSESVLEVIAKDGLVLSGAPWIKPGEEKKVGVGSFVGKCLCTAHNNALSPLDASAARFFDAIVKCDLERSSAPRRFLFSGHDIERWMLKTLAGLAASKNLSSDGTPLPGDFHHKIDLVALLQDPSAWKHPIGLFFTQTLGEQFLRGDHFGIAPISKMDTKEIVGMTVDLLGMRFSLLLAPLDAFEKSPLAAAVYRPARLAFKHKQLDHNIELSWSDNHRHGTVTMEFLMTHGERMKTAANRVDESKSY